jgi:hypothetical protein
MWLIPKGENAFREFEGTYVEEKDGALFFFGKADLREPGDFRTYPGNIANYAACIRELTDKDDNWRKYLFKLSLDTVKEKYILSYLLLK